MNSLDYEEGVKHLLKVEPAFKNIIPKTKISFFLRPEGFEGMASLIIEQQLSVKAADTIKKRVFGLMTKIASRNYLNLSQDSLKACGLSRQKINYLSIVANAEISGDLNYEAISIMSDNDAQKELCKLKGIGPWTADCYLMACLGRPDIWPVGDIGLQEGVRRLKHLKERPTIEDMTSIASDWRPFRSIAANILWADYD